MSETKDNKFFQNESKFKIGHYYETLRVKNLPIGSYKFDLYTCDEVGTIIPNSEIFLGKYISSLSIGYGDNGTRCDTFINDDGKEINHFLDYDGTTRYREVKRLDDKIHNLRVTDEKDDTKIN
jgi:hypothetical protein